ncbi:hypothetical protein [Fodinibius halophilus]|uniref:Uncharacterized protein n=1 Tax=Fodinibius halophilus TaxID=1736908 RepID=A0A6M1T8C9_9BACT|nr:hypothetical protein [Fodinibius halophilus]NGP88261.1 hypothetical protein [Fodinibius halophilus]
MKHSSKKIGYGAGLEYSSELREKLDQCRYFYLKSPRGGHFNDGYELIADIVYENSSQLLTMLDILEADYSLSATKPSIAENDKYCYCRPVEISLDKETQWLLVRHFPTNKDPSIYINYVTDELIRLIGNQSSWYKVTLYDIEVALQYDTKLEALKKVPQ